MAPSATINERITELRLARHGPRGKAAFARELGLNPSSYQFYEKSTSPPPAVISKICEITNTRHEWLLTGRGPKTEQELVKLHDAASQLRGALGLVRKMVGDHWEEIASRWPDVNVLAPSDSLQESIRNDFVTVPLLSDTAAAGSPREVSDDDVEDFCVIYRKWLTHPDDTTCIRVLGDSMDPVLQDGSIVAVNHAVNDLSEVANKIVAAHVEGEGVVIKWLRQTRSGRWILESENREYPVMDIDADSRIIGRVEWAWSVFR